MRKENREIAICFVIASAAFGACTALQLSQTQQNMITTNTSIYHFGNSLTVGSVNMTSGSNFTVGPAGSADDDFVTGVDIPGCGSDFQLQVPALPAEVGCSGIGTAGGSTMLNPSGTTGCTYSYLLFTASFTPSIPGYQSCDIVITAHPVTGGSNYPPTKITLDGSASGTPFQMAVSPNPLNFGSINVNSASMAKTVTVRNTGTQSFSLIVGPAPAPYTINPSLGVVIAANGSASFQMTCDHPSLGANTRTQSFTTGANEGMLSAPVTLNCDGVNANIVASPLDFGTKFVGDAQAIKSVDLTNMGTGSASLTNFRLSGTPADITWGAQPTGPINLAGGASFPNAFSIKYNPTTEIQPGMLGSVLFDDTVSGANGLSVPIGGGALTGSYATNPASLDFGPVCQGQAVTKDVEVYANGTADVLLMSKQNPQSPAFTITTSDVPKTLKAQHANSAIVHVKVQPTSVMDISDMLQLHAAIPSGADRAVPLLVHPLAQGVLPTPDAVHFAPTMMNFNSATLDVMLTNCGSGDLMVTGYHFEGTNADDFTVVAPPAFPVTLKSTESMTLHLLMNPHALGQRVAMLVIEHSQNNTTVPLDGTAFGGSTDSGNDRETYYACTAGHAAGAWPIALALLALRRRRR